MASASLAPLESLAVSPSSALDPNLLPPHLVMPFPELVTDCMNISHAPFLGSCLILIAFIMAHSLATAHDSIQVTAHCSNYKLCNNPLVTSSAKSQLKWLGQCQSSENQTKIWTLNLLRHAQSCFSLGQHFVCPTLLHSPNFSHIPCHLQCQKFWCDQWPKPFWNKKAKKNAVKNGCGLCCTVSTSAPQGLQPVVHFQPWFHTHNKCQCKKVISHQWPRQTLNKQTETIPTKNGCG